jgi:hypothetical protein
MPEALKYAQVQVAPLAKEKPEFVAELENIMSLLLFSNLSQSPDAHYLSNEQRSKTAHIANSALLRYAKHSDRPKIERIMKAIFWVQNTAQSLGVAVPKLLDLRTLTFDTFDQVDPAVWATPEGLMDADEDPAEEADDPYDSTVGDPEDDDDDNDDDDDADEDNDEEDSEFETVASDADV